MRPFASVLVPALMLAAGSVADASAQGTFSVHPSTQDPSVRVTLEKLAIWEKELTN